MLVVFAILSAVSGVARGIKWLSNPNTVLAALLVLFVLIAGPILLNMLPESVGAYLPGLPSMSFRTPAFGGLDRFSLWTIFYCSEAARTSRASPARRSRSSPCCRTTRSSGSPPVW